MNHQFSLTSNISDLPPINDGAVNPMYQEVSCQRTNTGTNFTGGIQKFQFSVFGNRWWLPKQTAFVVDCTLSDPAGTGVLNRDDIAAQMGLVGNLFNSFEMRFGNKVIQRASQFVPQLDALIARSTKSDVYLDSIGEAENMWANAFGVRLGEIHETEGAGGRRAYKFQLIYKPPLMLLHSYDKGIPSGNFSIECTPNPKASFKKSVVECTIAPGGNVPQPKGDGVVGEYDFSVDKMVLRVATIDGPRMDNGNYALSLEHLECQSTKINTDSLSQQYLTVSPATKSLVVAFQDTRVTENFSSPSRFCVAPATQNYPNQRGNNLANSLSRLFLQYAGTQKPQPDSTPEFNATTGIDRTTNRYRESLLANNQYLDPAGCETLEIWQQRGAYYWFDFARESTDGSTQVQVNSQFDAAAAGDDVYPNCNMLLFSLSETSVQIEVKNGKIINLVQIER
jgi:hypothetical protein